MHREDRRVLDVAGFSRGDAGFVHGFDVQGTTQLTHQDRPEVRSVHGTGRHRELLVAVNDQVPVARHRRGDLERGAREGVEHLGVHSTERPIGEGVGRIDVVGRYLHGIGLLLRASPQEIINARVEEREGPVDHRNVHVTDRAAAAESVELEHVESERLGGRGRLGVEVKTHADGLN